MCSIVLIDINECETGNNDCAQHCDNAESECVNTDGSYECRCANGYRNSSTSPCSDSKSMHISIPYSTIIFHAAVTAGFVRNRPQLIVVVLSLIVVVMGSAF